MLKRDDIETLTLEDTIEVKPEVKVSKKKNKKKRKLKKSAKVTLLIVPLVLLLLVGLYFVIFNKKEVPKKLDTVDPIQPVEKYKVSLVAVGDALIHRGVYYDADTYQIGADGQHIYNFKKMFPDIKEIVQNFDLAFYNQETIIGGKNIGLSNYPCFNSPDEIGLDMIDAGFNLVNLTTNHTKDRGIGAIQYSINFWKQQREKGVYTVGSYATEEERQEPRFEEKNGIKYALLGYSTVTNGFTISDADSHYWVLYSPQKVKDDIERVKDKVDVIMVSMHWGTEYVHTPIQEQKDIANYLASLGVNVVIGHHPHVVQPIEYIGDTLVIYSLGNFISAQDGTMKRVGLMAALDINKEVKDGETKITIDNARGDLLWTYYQSYKNFKVIPFSRLNDSILYNYRSIYEQYKKYLNPKGDPKVQVGFLN